MDNFHYNKIKNIVASLIQNYEGIDIDMVGASSNLTDVPIDILEKCNEINFIDYDKHILEDLKSKLVGFNNKVNFMCDDITGCYKILKSNILEIFKKANNIDNAIYEVSLLFNSFEVVIENKKNNKLFFSMNVSSELFLELRIYVEKMRWMFFGEKKIKDKDIENKYIVSCKRFQNLLIENHIKNALNYTCSCFFITCYENSFSYFNCFSNEPSDFQCAQYINKLVDQIDYISFWDWHITNKRKIRMLCFIVKS